MYFAFQRHLDGRIPVTFAERPIRGGCGVGSTNAKDIIWETLCKVPEVMEGLPLDTIAKWYMLTKEAKK